MREVHCLDGPLAGKTVALSSNATEFTAAVRQPLFAADIHTVAPTSELVTYHVDPHGPTASVSPPERRGAGAVEPLVLWRAWDVQLPEPEPEEPWKRRRWVAVDEPRLRSMAHPDLLWYPGETKRATCLRSLIYSRAYSSHRAPDQDCQCGIYVMDDLDQLLQESTQVVPVLREPYAYPERTVVVGEVEVWGQTVKHTHGRRVEYARLRSLVAPALLDRGRLDLGWLAESYDVPLYESDEVQRRLPHRLEWNGGTTAWVETHPGARTDNSFKLYSQTHTLYTWHMHHGRST